MGSLHMYTRDKKPNTPKFTLHNGAEVYFLSEWTTSGMIIQFPDKWTREILKPVFWEHGKVTCFMQYFPATCLMRVNRFYHGTSSELQFEMCGYEAKNSFFALYKSMETDTIKSDANSLKELFRCNSLSRAGGGYPLITLGMYMKFSGVPSKVIRERMRLMRHNIPYGFDWEL